MTIMTGKGYSVLEMAVATQNPGKLEELQKISQGWPVRLTGMATLGLTLSVRETGTSFDENALIKARALHQAAGGWVMADDSGLVVDALGGEPGIYSARYAGRAATDRENYLLLLDRLKGVARKDRQAHFHCSLAVISPDGREELFHGKTEGSIAWKACGSSGFGYDPVFIPLGGRCTLAELPADRKNAISHRGRALRLFLEKQFPQDPDQERKG